MMKLRKPALTLHRYLGVMAGILLVIIGLTGSLLVFSEELEHFLNPHLLQVAPQGERVSPQLVVDVAQKVYPDLLPHRITVPQTSEQVYTVMMASPQDEYTDIYVNPYNAEVLGSRPWKQTLGGFLIESHVHLFAGDLGMQVVGICGLLLLLISMTGLILWAGWRRFATGFKIRWKSPWQLVNYDLHKVGGILSVVLLSLVAFTGAAMIFWTQFEGAVYWLTRTPIPVEPTSKASTLPPMGIDEILQKADTALPSAKTFKFFPAKKPEDPFKVWKTLPQKNDLSNDGMVYLDQYTGEVLRLDNDLKAPLATRIMNALHSLHIGSYGGVGVQIIYVFIGIAPTVLFITGFIIWWSKTYGAKSPKRRRSHSK